MLKKTIYIPEKTKEMLDSFISASRCEVEFSAKIQEIIIDLCTLLSRTKREVKGRFSENEWNYLRDMLNGTILQSDVVPYRFVLTAEAEDANRYEGLGEKWNVDVKKLIEKLKNLSEFEAYTVAKMVDEFWASADTAEEGSFSDENQG